MSSYTTALKSLVKSDPFYEVHIYCSICKYGDSDQEQCLSKSQAFKGFIDQGWSYDDEGKWCCPDCSTAAQTVSSKFYDPVSTEWYRIPEGWVCKDDKRNYDVYNVDLTIRLIITGAHGRWVIQRKNARKKTWYTPRTPARRIRYFKSARNAIASLDKGN